MLQMPDWDKPKTVTPSLEGFISWLETKNPEEAYNWYSTFKCVVAQYAQSLGLQIHHVTMDEPWHDCVNIFGATEDYIYVGFGGHPPVNTLMHSYAKEHDLDHTFGGALKRAKELLSARTG